ncbi:MAG TPA: type II toxin-antitoxin system VapC family toxin [Usitatibacter sp.]|nr:type II toxin-antitoxin system VapC family toxin [Usitatibacter sp.]
MIGLDTNVVIRYLAQDEPRQAAAATRVFERTLSPENPGVLTQVTLCEVAWVLAECYGADRDRIRSVIEGLLATRQILVQDADIVWKALRAWTSSTADFSDALIGESLRAQGCSKVVTFDKAAARLPGWELLPP